MMKLKTYQEKVITDLKKYLSLLEEHKDIERAYNLLWQDKNVMPGMGKIRPYNNLIPGVPHVCMKVPTGGGKTLLGCSAIKYILDSMSDKEHKLVIWLVPTDTIYKQTHKNLSDNRHDYRINLNNDFGGNINVINKEEALSRKGFSAASIKEEVTILIISYDSIRSKKKTEKVYAENGSNLDFVQEYKDRDSLVADVDDTALINVINQCNPIVIVDESHHAKSDLSIEMLKNLNPSFILDLTATPKSNSNIISIVEAWELKKEHMVKLPVVVYNRKNKEQVIADAIELRDSLDRMAQQTVAEDGKYIRPIVLFQAETNTDEDATTYEKLKQSIIKNFKIKEEEIAIKIAGKDEISKKDLFSEDCKIKYIITINALKEGWDCSFAYILATLANRSSLVDVEQIVGRILRQPYTEEQKSKFLNMCYVITSSDDFYGAVDKVINGLNAAGFSDKDVKAIEETPKEEIGGEQIELTDVGNITPKTSSDTEQSEEDPFEVNEKAAKAEVEKRQDNTQEISESVADILKTSEEASDNLDSLFTQNQDVMNGMNTPFEVVDRDMVSTINEEFSDSIRDLVIPCFYIKKPQSIFNIQEEEWLTDEVLLEDFTLRNADTNIEFNATAEQIVSIDIEKGKRPQYLKMNADTSKQFKANFSNLPSDKKKEECKHFVKSKLEKLDNVDFDDLRRYVDKVIDSMTLEQIESIDNTRLFAYYECIKKKVTGLQKEFKEKQFELLKNQRKIVCKPHFQFPDYITPMQSTSDIAKGLYTKEYCNFDNFERDVIIEIASQKNVLWWHRNPERKKKESFIINGFFKHYPDFIIMTESGNVVVIETKGNIYRDSAKDRLKLGKQWEASTPERFCYYMLFDKEPIDGALTWQEFINNVLPVL